MSINKPSALPAQPAVSIGPPGTHGLQLSTSGANTSPNLRTRQVVTDVGWQDLPDDVLAALMDSLMTDVESPGLAPENRSTALRSLVGLGNASHREHRVLEHVLEQRNTNPSRLWQQMAEVSRPQWRSMANHLDTHRDTLIGDFSATRTLITNAEKSKKGIALPENCEGVEFCFKEIEFSPAIRKFIPQLAGKIVKIDATRIGAERFANEILPMLSEIPGDCAVVLDAAGNNLDSGHVDELVCLMASKCNIYRLDLSGNPLTTGVKGIGPLVKLFGHAGPLTHLYLDNAGIDGATFAALIKEFPSFDGRSDCTMLQQLDLRNNRLDANGAIQVTQALIPPRSAGGLMSADLSLLRLAGNVSEITEVMMPESLRAKARQQELTDPTSRPEPVLQTDEDEQPIILIGAQPFARTLDIELPGGITSLADEVRAQMFDNEAQDARL